MTIMIRIDWLFWEGMRTNILYSSLKRRIETDVMKLYVFNLIQPHVRLRDFARGRQHAGISRPISRTFRK